MKHTTSKETLYVIASVAVMLALIVLTSIANAGLDPSQIFSKENVSNFFIAAAITVYGTICAIPAGTVSTKRRTSKDGKPGRYMQAFAEYQTARAEVSLKREAFSQWNHAQYVNEVRQKKINYLLEHGVTQATEILELSIEQADTLTTSQAIEIAGTTHYLKALTEEQLAHVHYVLEGRVSVHKVPDFYFLYVEGKSTKSFYDQAHYEAKDESRLLIGKITSKVFIGFIIACIFSGLVFMPIEGLSTREVVLKALLLIASRVFNAISSTYWGWLIGQDLAYKQCYYISGRTQFLKAFLNDTSFTPLSDEESAMHEVTAKESVCENKNSYSGAESSDGSALVVECPSEPLPQNSDCLK